MTKENESIQFEPLEESSFPIETLRKDFIKKLTIESNLKMVESFLQRRSWIKLSKAFENIKSSRTVVK
jgi:hypothetical protein